MAHFAEIKPTSNIDLFEVTQVIVADQSFIDSGAVGDAANWVQTSYNTRGGIHYGQDGQPDGGVALRANYAGIGYTYDKGNDVFYASQPYPSWIIGAPDWIWKPPVPYPTDGQLYNWDETTQTWILSPNKT